MSMKKMLLFLVSIFFSVSVCAEEVSPTFNVEIERKVSYIDIEGEMYYDCVVAIRASSATVSVVSVQIKDKNGKRIYVRKFKGSYLYIFSSGQIQIGKPRFDKVVIYSRPYGSYVGKIREKEGVY